MIRTQQEKPPRPPRKVPHPHLDKTTISTACSVCAFACGNDNKESILHIYSLLPAAAGALTGCVQSAADQILPVRRVRKRHSARLDHLNRPRSAESHQKERWSSSPGARICTHACVWSHFFFLFFFFFPRASYGSVFLTCVGPLQNKQWCSEPRAASVHTAFLRHCMKIDGFDIISKASLSHNACSGEGDRMRSTGPLLSSPLQRYTQLVFYLCIHPLALRQLS